MPFFGGSRREPSPPEVIKDAASTAASDAESHKRHGFFRRRSYSNASSSDSASPARNETAMHTNMTPVQPGPSRSPTKSSRTGTIKGGLFGKREHADVDPSIIEARERVETAEAAEMAADRALEQARIRVREARENVKRIEMEAREEVRKAQIKQFHAQEVMKRGQGLGRHGE